MTGDEIGFRSVKSTERYLGVSRWMIYSLGERGELELVKIGRSTRVTQKSLDRYVKSLKGKKKTVRGKV